MSILSGAYPPKSKIGKIIVLYGAEGSGKTTIASTFPSPFFLRTEDGTESIANNQNVATLDVCKNKDDVTEQLKAIRSEEHNFKTLVIDSITSLNNLFEKSIIDQYKVSSLELAAGGYGKGYVELAMIHLGLCKYLRDIATSRSMNIVLIGHADIDKISSPDSEAYTSYVLRMHKKSRDAYIECADCVAYINIRTIIKSNGNGLKTGERFLICYPTAAQQSKNRWGIEESIDIFKDKNPLEEYL